MWIGFDDWVNVFLDLTPKFSLSLFDYYKINEL